jgi:hypothetical protein
VLYVLKEASPLVLGLEFVPMETHFRVKPLFNGVPKSRNLKKWLMRRNGTWKCRIFRRAVGMPHLTRLAGTFPDGM